MDRRNVAREWLLFVGLIAVGLIVVPPILVAIAGGSGVSRFYKALFDCQDWLVAWLFVLGPYAIAQLIRSVFWAVRVSRTDSRH